MSKVYKEDQQPSKHVYILACTCCKVTICIWPNHPPQHVGSSACSTSDCYMHQLLHLYVSMQVFYGSAEEEAFLPAAKRFAAQAEGQGFPLQAPAQFSDGGLCSSSFSSASAAFSVSGLFSPPVFQPQLMRCCSSFNRDTGGVHPAEDHEPIQPATFTSAADRNPPPCASSVHCVPMAVSDIHPAEQQAAVLASHSTQCDDSNMPSFHPAQTGMSAPAGFSAMQDGPGLDQEHAPSCTAFIPVLTASMAPLSHSEKQKLAYAYKQQTAPGWMRPCCGCFAFTGRERTVAEGTHVPMCGECNARMEYAQGQQQHGADGGAYSKAASTLLQRHHCLHKAEHPDIKQNLLYQRLVIAAVTDIHQRRCCGLSLPAHKSRSMQQA